MIPEKFWICNLWNDWFNSKNEFIFSFISACNCDLNFSTGNCADGTGQCECRPEFLPPYCDECNVGYYGYPECKLCDCHPNGTYGNVCEVGGGQCPCKANYGGKNCDRCKEEYYGFPDCLRKCWNFSLYFFYKRIYRVF